MKTSSAFKIQHDAPHVESAIAYAEDVVRGEVVACKWTIAACFRFLSDLRRIGDADFPYHLSEPSAEDICDFVEQLPHVKGRWKTPGLTLERWQNFLFVNVWGWLHVETGYRRFRTAYIEVPRKNGKSTPTAGASLYMLAADNEDGAECYSAATTRDQAKIVFGVAKEMARRSDGLRRAFGVSVQTHNINVLRSASKFEPLSSDAHSLDGLNVHFAAVDELHAHKTREVYDVLETATGSRTQSLLWLITTAGTNRAGICYEIRTYLTKILNAALARMPENPHRIEGGSASDETFFGCIWTIDDGDDWTDPKVWAKANPNLGVSVFQDDLERKCRKAVEMPSAANNFLTKHLNVWVNADTSWMDMRAWDRAEDSTLKLEHFEDQPVIIGLDIASTTDIAVKMRLFERKLPSKDEKKASEGGLERHFYAFGSYYLPEEEVDGSANSQYAGWARAGKLTLTDGNTIDYETIEADLLADADRFDVREVPHDPWQAKQLAQRMTTAGIPMVEMRPTVANFSQPMKELEAIVLSGRFHHDGDPILAWMVSNVVAHTDAKDNIYPRKERSENKIDGVVALLMALGRALLLEEKKESVYETRGLRTFG